MAIKNLSYYPYTHAKSFIANPTDPWATNNYRGQVYEAHVYDAILQGESVHGMITGKIVLRGPYATARPTSGTELRFSYNKERSLYYTSGGETIAEFDMLVVAPSKVQFIECTISDSNTNVKNLVAKIIRKRNLLRLLFPSCSVSCLIASDKQLNDSNFASVPFVSTVSIPFPQVNLLQLAKTARLDHLRPSPSSVTIGKINSCSSSFDYFATMHTLSGELWNVDDLHSVLGKIKNRYSGLIERIYWGWVPFSGLTPGARSIIADSVCPNLPDSIVTFLYIPVKDPTVLRYVYPLPGAKRNQWMEINPLKKRASLVPHRKRLAKDLGEISRLLPHRKAAELKILLARMLNN